jgi:hypothetical protein
MKGMIDIEYIPTGDMIVDVFTKVLPKIKHWKCMEDMRMRKVHEGEEGVVNNRLHPIMSCGARGIIV